MAWVRDGFQPPGSDEVFALVIRLSPGPRKSLFADAVLICATRLPGYFRAGPHLKKPLPRLQPIEAGRLALSFYKAFIEEADFQFSQRRPVKSVATDD